MDLHNNLVGREYFQSIATIKEKKRRFWFTKKWLECPSNTTLKAEIKKRADNATKTSKDVNSIKRVSSSKLVYIQ